MKHVCSNCAKWDKYPNPILKDGWCKENRMSTPAEASCTKWEKKAKEKA